VTDRVLTPEMEARIRVLAPLAAELVPMLNARSPGKLIIEGLSRGDTEALFGVRAGMPAFIAEVDRLRAERDRLDRAASHLSATLAEYVGIKRERDLLRAEVSAWRAWADARGIEIAETWRAVVTAEAAVDAFDKEG